MTESDPEKLERTLAGGLRLPDNCVEDSDQGTISFES